MGEPVNLNRFKKQKARAEKAARADQNAVKFGQTKAEKQRSTALREKESKLLDGHRKE